MAWFAIDLDNTLISEENQETGEMVPTEGAVDAMLQLTNEGHRISVFTHRFAPMPEIKKQQMKDELVQKLMAIGFPEMEVWTGTTKPGADIFIDDKAVTFDNDWGLALAQSQMMLEERGLLPPPSGAPADDEQVADEAAPDAPSEEI